MQSDDSNTIFVSYARADSAFALKLAKELRTAGINIWIDQLDIPAGVPWDDRIESVLRQCRALLVVLSPASVASRNVKDELAEALGKGKQIVPVLLSPCDLPMRIRRLHYIDLSVEYERGRERLLQELAPFSSSAPSQGSSPPERPTPEKRKPATVQSKWLKRLALVVGLVVIGVGMVRVLPFISSNQSQSKAAAAAAAATPAPATPVGPTVKTRREKQPRPE